ncbi:hypothetical protein [Glycomyces sp. NPDC048151]|uniref:hypothetical protein n=1 Tax=Glycomyces sp. NPDC048151 TaxID=3364002 RepID=UPI003718B198
MSDDIEALLRSGLAERAAAAPAYDDPGLAEAAIAGAGRIRRRRRVASAAGGAGLLVLGAAAFVWQPWTAPDQGGDGVIAADTSTAEAQSELGMEFLIEEPDGSYTVLDAEGNGLTFDMETPVGYVYKLATSYMSEGESEVTTFTIEGDVTGIVKPSATDTMTRVNSVGDGFAMVTPNADLTAEAYELVDVSLQGGSEIVDFTTNYVVTLEDWDATTAVFSTDLYSSTAGEPGSFYFNEEFDLGLESVSAAGFQSAVLVDQTDVNHVCVADLDGAGAVGTQEQCGSFDSDEIQAQLAGAAGENAEDPSDLVAREIEEMSGESYFDPTLEMDLGEYQSQYDNASNIWDDPLGRWQIVGDPGDDAWLLFDRTGDEPVLSELEPPEGALMPILSYS